MNYIPNQSNIRKEWSKENTTRKIKEQNIKKKHIIFDKKIRRTYESDNPSQYDKLANRIMNSIMINNLFFKKNIVYLTI
jgi:hypothetical protein